MTAELPTVGFPSVPVVVNVVTAVPRTVVSVRVGGAVVKSQLFTDAKHWHCKARSVDKLRYCASTLFMYVVPQSVSVVGTCVWLNVDSVDGLMLVDVVDGDADGDDGVAGVGSAPALRRWREAEASVALLASTTGDRSCQN